MFLFPLSSVNSFFSAPRTPTPHSTNQGEDESCNICYHNFSDPDAEDPVALACGHIFGTTCIEKWTSINSTCPMCRADLFKTDFSIDHGSEIDDRMDPMALLQQPVELDSLDEDYSWAGPILDPVFVKVDDDGTDSECSEQCFDTHDGFDQPSILSAKSSFDLDEVQLYDLDLYECYEELRSSHEQWMSEFLEDKDSNGDDPIGLFDVFSY
ncbi:hypothetical protein BKA63DRAFT_608760 [Paraphoma chrysanthemicola]|nr:hypothetical protein BKA63DRAFT_608760 [Paraphoma chrysanthemicola]